MPWHAYVMCVSQLRVLTMRLNIRLQYFVILPSVKHWTLEAQWLLTLSFLCCPIMWLYVLSYVLWYAYKRMLVFTSSCLLESSCLIYSICVCLRTGVSNTYDVVFLFLSFFVLCTLCFQFHCPFDILDRWLSAYYTLMETYKLC